MSKKFLHGLEVENQDEEEKDVVHVKKVVNQGNHEEEIKEKAEKGDRVENLEKEDVVKFLGDFSRNRALLFSPFSKSISNFL